MPIIQVFEEHNFKGGSIALAGANFLVVQLPIINKNRYGNGFADIIPSITNFIGIIKN